MNLADLDVAYVVRPGDTNEELRYSLRSVAALLPHLDVTIAGHIPPWLNPAEVVGIHVAQTAHAKPLNALTNLQAILDCAFLTDEIILMNDDFFCVAPVTDIPPTTPGPLSWQIDRGKARSVRYRQAQEDTLELVEGYITSNPWSYEGHRPIVVNRHELNETLARIRAIAPTAWPPERVASILWRTVYGAQWWAHLPRATGADVKIDTLDPTDIPVPFVSTNDSTFARGAIGRWLRARFPDPCRYERTTRGDDPWA